MFHPVKALLLVKKQHGTFGASAVAILDNIPQNVDVVADVTPRHTGLILMYQFRQNSCHASRNSFADNLIISID